MKTILNTLMLTTMAVAGFAADNKLNFYVEFPFTVGKVEMPSGQYSVSLVTRRANVIHLLNATSGKGAFVNLPVPSATLAPASKAEIVFRCGDAGCSIAKVTNLAQGTSLSALAGKQNNPRLIAVSLTPTLHKAD